jgi:hypothetical protein
MEEYAETIVKIAQVFMVPLLTYAVTTLRSIKHDIWKLTESTIRMEAWQDGHEKLDDARFDSVHGLISGHHPQ